MKRLIATLTVGAILLFSMSPVAFGGEQDGPVFDPRPTPIYQLESTQTQEHLTSGDEQKPLNPDVRG